MKISFERKIILGFIVNLLIVSGLGLVVFLQSKNEKGEYLSGSMDLLSIGLVVVSLILLTVVFFIIRNQLSARRNAQQSLLDNKVLLQSIIDNTTNPIYIKKINGEYLFANKPCEDLFNLPLNKIVGKTDHDILSIEIADKSRQSDLDVVKAGKELKFEEVIELEDGPHTFISVKFPLFDSTGRVYAVGTIATDINERKALEDSMRAGDKFFRISLDILVIADKNLFIKINPALSRILGYSEQELLEKPFTEFILPDDLEKTGEVIQSLQGGKTTVNFENRWLCKDGTIKWLSWTAIADMSTGLLYAVAHDVTDRKETHEALAVYEKFFNMSFDAMVVGKGEHFIKVNPAFTRILGRGQKEMDSAPFLTYAHPDDLERSKEAVERLRKGEAMVNFKARSRIEGGAYKWLDWSATADPHTGLLYGVARDITEQVKLEEDQQQAVSQLFENEQKLRLILENIGDAVIVANNEKEVVLSNYMANEIFGVEADDQLSSGISERYEIFFPDEKTIFPSQNLPLDRALNGESTDDVDVVLWNERDQEKRRVLISGRPIVDKEKEVIAAVVTIKDISRYKQLEQELKDTEMKYRRVIGFRKDKEEE